MSRAPDGARLVLGVVFSAALVLAGASAGRAATVPSGDTEARRSLAPIEAPGPTQVMVYDRVVRSSAIISHDQGGRPAEGSSSRPSISADGTAVAFESDAAIVPEDTDGSSDIYLWTRAPDRLQRLSIGLDGSPPNGASHDPSISGDGEVVAFTSFANDLTPDGGPGGATSQIFAWQRLAGVTLVSVPVARADATSGAPSVSQDGRVVAFESAASDLVTGDSNAARDIFLRDLARSATIRASVASDGEQVGEASRRPSISADGGAVVFDSMSGELDPPDSNGARDVFVRDLPPAVQVAPDPIDFGEVPLGTPASRSATVLSVGWTPVAMSSSTVTGADAGDFIVADDGCAGAALAYGAECLVIVLHVPTATGPRTATLEIADNALDSPQLVSLVGGVPGAVVRLEPAVGPPGVVTVLTGSNFPPGALVTVEWDRGITQLMAPIPVGPEGAFSVGVLVFHKDRLGPRQLIISSAAGGPPFDATLAPFLVVPAALQPPGTRAVSFSSLDTRPILVTR